MSGFRPQFWPTLVAVPALCVLLGLGLWQLERLQWKEGLIADLDARVVADPVPMPGAVSADDRYLKVKVSGIFDHGREIRSHMISATEGVGVQMLTPLERDNGDWLLVSRGFVPPGVDAIERPQGRVTLQGLLRVPGGGNSFTPPPDAAAKMLYALDMAAAEQMMGLEAGVLPPLYLEVAATPDGVWPKGGQTPLTIKNDHLEYALTWFGLALTLVGVYIAWHVQAARGERKKD